MMNLTMVNNTNLCIRRHHKQSHMYHSNTQLRISIIYKKPLTLNNTNNPTEQMTFNRGGNKNGNKHLEKMFYFSSNVGM